MKKASMAILPLLVALSLSNQPRASLAWDWALSAGGHDIDNGNSIATDAMGNVIIVGNFGDSLRFGNTMLRGFQDMFVAKFNGSGNLQWAKSAIGQYDDRAVAVASDGSGNIYVTGFFGGFIDFGGPKFIAIDASMDMFLVKYSPDGKALWARQAGGYGNQIGTNVKATSRGNILLSGCFEGAANFGDTTLISRGRQDIFMATYDSSGNRIWLRQIGGKNRVIDSDIDIDSNDNTYLAFMFDSSATICDTTLSATSSENLSIAKFDPSGRLSWFKKPEPGVYYYSIAIGPDACLLVTGAFIGTQTFNSISFSSYGSTDIFAAKYDSAGHIAWATHAGGYQRDYGICLACDGHGNAYVTGAIQGVARFVDTTIGSGSEINGFIAAYDAGGDKLWLMESEGQPSGMAINSNGDVFLVGNFQDSMQFGRTKLLSSGYDDIWMAKLSTRSEPISRPHAIKAKQSGLEMASFGGQRLRLEFEMKDQASNVLRVDLLNAAGVVVRSYSFSARKNGTTVFVASCDNLPDGVYIARVRGERGILGHACAMLVQ